jgi:SAM-dependent methyltransferase
MSAEYAGNELEFFALARHWKAFFARQLPPLGGRVLEVGAGIGATTAALCDGSQQEWLCLEPDERQRAIIDEHVSSGRLPACCRTVGGTLQDLPAVVSFDSILYIDVLEHIQADAAELQLAASRLLPGGSLVVLSPAHPFLHSRFDDAIGHYRRYTSSSLAALQPADCRLTRSAYLDSAGLLTSLANRFLLRQELPTVAQILFWDRWLVWLSRLLDPLTGYRLGRSILVIWKRK